MKYAMRWVRRFGLPTVAASALVLMQGSVGAHDNIDEWTSAGQNIQNTRANLFEHQISPSNVGKLGVKWVFTTQGDVSATPSVDADSVYTVDFGGYVHRLHRKTGSAVWSKKVSDLVGITYTFPFPFPLNISRTTPAIDDHRVIFGTQAGAWVIALDKASGGVLWKTQVDTHDLYAIVTTSPVVFGELVYVGVASTEEGIVAIEGQPYPCCAARGSVVALNKRTGAILWQTYTLPEQSGPTADRFAGAGVWGSTAAVDIVRRSLYIGTGNAYWAPDSVRLCIQANNLSGSLDQDPHATCTIQWEQANHAHVYVDSILALDLVTGQVKWSRRLWGADVWNVACFALPVSHFWCPTPTGPDFDFAQGPSLFTVFSKKGPRQLVGAGQKSGIYWALDPDDGNVVWSHQVGPGGIFGGLEWGSAVDLTRVYTALANSDHMSYLLQPSGTSASAGGWAALDAATGKPVWQVEDPAGNLGLGPISVANGVAYACSLDPVNGTMYAFDAASGHTLWSFSTGASCAGGAAVADGTVYWGTGYGKFAPFGFHFTPSNKLYAFEVKNEKNEKQ